MHTFVALARRASQILSNERLSARRRGRAKTALAVACALAFVNTSCVKLPRRASAQATAAQKEMRDTEAGAARVNLNTATRAELKRLPGLGPALAARVVEHRERHGPFRRAEHLIVVRGFGERRFRRLRALVEV